LIFIINSWLELSAFKRALRGKCT